MASAADSNSNDNANENTQQTCFRVCLCFHDGIPFFEVLRLAERRRADPDGSARVRAVCRWGGV